jgi:hypothetical protein
MVNQMDFLFTGVPFVNSLGWKPDFITAVNPTNFQART